MNDFKITAMTPETLAEKFPDVFKAVESNGYVKGVDEGFKDGHIKGFAEGQFKGAEIERQRIKAVEAQALSGHEALIEGLKYDGKTTGEQAAIAVLNAEKEKRKTRMQTLEESASKPVPPSNTDAQQFSGVDPNASVEDRAKAEWDKNLPLRAEFGSVQSYTAYLRAIESGRARILKK
ncbi:MAG: hypothetical protein E3K37_01320 [Candidatus Kuenenia sp.]|nr:hypothetical protein [Candidatus Kuenenia hertensis]